MSVMEQCPRCGVVQDPLHPICTHMAGRKGGRMVVAKRGREHLAAAGKLGGLKNAEKGHHHFAALGRRSAAGRKAK